MLLIFCVQCVISMLSTVNPGIQEHPERTTSLSKGEPSYSGKPAPLRKGQVQNGSWIFTKLNVMALTLRPSDFQLEC